VAYLIYVLFPLAVLVLYAFHSTEYQIWPMEGLTLQWFRELLDDSKLLLALKNSVLIGLATMFFSTLIGGGFAYGLVRYTFRGKAFLETLNILCIITYGVVSAVSVLLWFRMLGIHGGIWPTIVGHTTFIMPFAVMVIRDRLLNFDREIEEAAMDLGQPPSTFWDVTLLIMPSSWQQSFCFTISGRVPSGFLSIGNR
jgi:spermidine/putrescine transport system permease protein